MKGSWRGSYRTRCCGSRVTCCNLRVRGRACRRVCPCRIEESLEADLSPKQAEMVVILMAHLALVDGELHQAEEAVCHDFAQALGLRVQRWVAIMESVAEQHNTAIKLTHGASKKGCTRSVYHVGFGP